MDAKTARKYRRLGRVPSELTPEKRWRTLDLVVQMSRHVGGRRLVNQITEIEPLGDDGPYRLRDVFTSQVRPHEKTMPLTWTGKRSTRAGHLRPEEQAQVTDLTRAIFEVPKS